MDTEEGFEEGSEDVIVEDGIDDETSIEQWRMALDIEIKSLNEELDNLNKLSFSDDEDFLSDDFSLDYLKRLKLSKVKDFFVQWSEMPSISDLSLSVEEEEAVQIEEDEEEVGGLKRDVGSFVNPLTGSIISTSSSVSITSKLLDEPSTAIGEEQSAELSSLHSGVFKMEDMETAHVDFGEMPSVYSIKVKDSDEEIITEQSKREERERKIRVQASTERFVHTIADKAVESVEGRDAMTILAAKVDKYQLLQQLCEDIKHLFEERRIKDFLNLKTSESFRRKKNFSATKAESAEVAGRKMKIFEESLMRLDVKLLQEADMKAKHANLMATVSKDLAEISEATIKAEDIFVHEIFNTLIRADASQRLKAFVQKTFKKIAESVVEMSKARRNLIKVSHRNAVLTERYNQIEKLTSEITLTEHELSIIKTGKMYERVNDLKCSIVKHQREYNNILHMMAHMREGRFLINLDIQDNVHLLKELKLKYKNSAKKQNTVKLQYAELQKTYTEVEFNTGLLSKPALMLDYDKTLEQLETDTQTVENLRFTYRSIQLKNARRSINKSK